MNALRKRQLISNRLRIDNFIFVGLQEKKRTKCMCKNVTTYENGLIQITHTKSPETLTSNIENVLNVCEYM